jgi:hypothetical protein
VWDGVPHLDGSVLKSAGGAYYLLQSGKKWRIASDEVLATWVRAEELLSASDEELASYPEGTHPLGLRAGVLFKGSSGPVCTMTYEALLRTIRAFQPASLVVSLGYDAYQGDPLSAFRVEAGLYPVIGSRIAALHLPTLLVQEGGYALEALPVLAESFVTGFLKGMLD